MGLDAPSGEGIVLFVPKEELFGQKVGMIMNDPQNGGQIFYMGANTNGDLIINMDVQGTGRCSMGMDSTAFTNFKYYDYLKNTEKTLLKSQ